MATKKTKVEKTKEKKPVKKKDSIVLDMPGTIGSAKIVLPKEKKTKSKNISSGSWPKIEQGTHLTITTYENGRTELVWDWDALVSEVRVAILKAESNIPAITETKPKKAKKVK
jgi:hypothetical protein